MRRRSTALPAMLAVALANALAPAAAEAGLRDSMGVWAMARMTALSPPEKATGDT
ncbi:MAG: hypothetical protein ABW048_11940 [Sphingobium sp.]